MKKTKTMFRQHKVIVAILAVAMMFSMVGASALTLEKVETLSGGIAKVTNGSALADEESIIPGSGTSFDPYLITTEAQLTAIATGELTNGLSAHFVLQNDIALSTSFWIPIGKFEASFTGVFDGNGYTISGLKHASENEEVGLFGCFAGTVKNLTISGDVSGKDAVGILVGWNTGGTIENCFTSGTVNATGNYAGGLVGYNRGTVKTSGSTAEVTGYCHVGGLIGFNDDGYGIVENCYAQGNVTGTDSDSVGGFVGENWGEIRTSYASGKVNDCTGNGFAAHNYGILFNSYYRSINGYESQGYPVSTTNMKLQSTYYMWDFDNIWEMNGDYPTINVRGETPEIEFEGDGDVELPYLIETEKQLYALAAGYAKTGEKVYYKLKNDIAVSAAFWTPIGNKYAPFIGVFDGNGYTISGIKNAGAPNNYIGLFANNGGTIKNLTVAGVVDGYEYIGILTGRNTGTIENCFTSGTANGEYYVGGMVGYNENGFIKTSGSTATVSGVAYIGGFVGYNYGDIGLIENCYAQGDVTDDDGYDLGGFVGGNYGTIRLCYASGKVNDCTGNGFAWHNGGTIFNCYYRSINGYESQGYPVSTTNMKLQSTYYMWDFDNIWEMNGDYPTINVRGKTPAVIFEGDGDSEYPYLIENEKQLYALAAGYAKTGDKIYYQLKNDIAVTARFWTPIGSVNTPFIGIFDGNGYTISGIKNTGTCHEYVGLFGYNSGTIKNLTVNGNVSGVRCIGILAGCNIGGAIENCFTSGSADASDNCVGGLVGFNENGTINTSGSDATVSGYAVVGGLVGRSTNSNHARITNCYAKGNVTGDSYVGGFIGDNAYESVIQYCYSTGAVPDYGTDAGGFAGYYSSGEVLNSYYNYETAGRTDTVHATPETTANMKLAATYEGWDFSNVWGISSDINDGYPYLKALTAAPSVVPVTGVSLNKTASTMTVGETLTLTATVSPTNADNKAVTWTSSNTSVATVSNGVVTAKAAGTATITVTTADGSKTATCTVTVNQKQQEPEDQNYKAAIHTESTAGKVYQGKSFSFTVSLSGTYDGFCFNIPTYNGLTITEVVGADAKINVDKIGEGFMVSVLGDRAKVDSDKEIIVTVNGTVNADASLGDVTLGLTDILLTTETGDQVKPVENIFGTVEITDRLPGDINNDGIFNYLDVSKLYAYFREKTTVDSGATVDINGDGIFNYLDVSKLYAIFREKASF